ncbi:MAG TPA: ABC transporter substrate-binding protein [Aestuariivirga sp.]|nr:ABC transporter substrate-binding protein [Aestuariivirga sp.]
MITRRALLGFIAASSISPALAADHPSIAFMHRFGKDMLAAHRLGTVGKFSGVIEAYADVAGISNYSLGQYKPNLRASQRSRYYQGVVTFMARYFAEQSREYRVAKYEIGEATIDANKDVIVGSKIYLLSGQTYNVRWKLTWRNGTYKISDVKVMGFSLTYLQRGLFTSYISKRKGDVSQLVAALTR